MLTLCYLALIFLIILILLALRRPLYQAMLCGTFVLIILYRIPPNVWVVNVTMTLLDWSSVSILLTLFLITYLQRILEYRKQLKLAEEDLNQIFQNRRVNTMVGPLFIGLLPSAAAMVLCGDIVKESTQEHLSKDNQAFLTTWIRHIPEAFLPTYPAVLLMTTLAGVPLSSFMLGMIPVVVFLLVLVYFKFVRQIPRTPDISRNIHPVKASINLLRHLWSLIFLLGLISIFQLDIVGASLITILLALIVYRIPISKMTLFFKTAFETKLLGNMFVVLVFKSFLDNTGILKELPNSLQDLQLPVFLIFVVLFFLGGIISGAAAIVAVGTPLALAAMPSGGVPLLVLLMSSAHAASQLSPTHMCLTVVSNYYRTPLLGLMKKTLPYSLATLVFGILYYLFLNSI